VDAKMYNRFPKMLLLEDGSCHKKKCEKKEFDETLFVVIRELIF